MVPNCCWRFPTEHHSLPKPRRGSGGEEGAFSVLNHLKLVKLAVSLGSTESLAQHPDTMTHAGVELAHKRALGITPGMIRLSVGVEHPDDLIWDLEQALATPAKTEAPRMAAFATQP